MEFLPTKFDSARVIVPNVFEDKRGAFFESYSERAFADHGIAIRFVQDNHSVSKPAGVLRGMHFQLPPVAQTKLVRVVKGAVLDVLVDLRKDSPTYGQWEGHELSAENRKMLLVPKGFAHGFCTLTTDTEFLYKVDNPYSPEHDRGLPWNDPDLGIDWPVEDPIVSDKDRRHAPFSQFESPFTIS